MKGWWLEVGTNHRCGSKVGGTFRANPTHLGSKSLVEKFLKLLVEKLEMQDLTTVISDVADELKKMNLPIKADEGGMTAVVVLSTSHIALHTWPEDSGATFDIHSCRDFDVLLVRSIIAECFETNDIDIYDLSYSLRPDHGFTFRVFDNELVTNEETEFKLVANSKTIC